MIVHIEKTYAPNNAKPKGSIYRWNVTGIIVINYKS